MRLVRTLSLCRHRRFPPWDFNWLFLQTDTDDGSSLLWLFVTRPVQSACSVVKDVGVITDAALPASLLDLKKKGDKRHLGSAQLYHQWWPVHQFIEMQSELLWKLYNQQNNEVRPFQDIRVVQWIIPRENMSVLIWIKCHTARSNCGVAFKLRLLLVFCLFVVKVLSYIG